MRSLPLVKTTAPDLGMLEADALQRVVQFDVDAEVVGVELERVARRDAAILGDVEHERRHPAVELQAPMAIALGLASRR